MQKAFSRSEPATIMASYALVAWKQTFRFYCMKATPGSRYVKPLQGVKRFLVKKYFAFVRGYERVLETKFPRTFRVYQVFVVGTQELISDIKEYIKISQDLRRGKSVRDLTRRELEKYFQIPKDMMKVGPVLLLAALPFANYVVFPVAYFFPKFFLSPHFWSLQQRVEFAAQSHRKKLYSYRPVFRHLQAKVATVGDHILQEKCTTIFHKLGSGLHPEVNEILEIKPLFVQEPYNLHSISSSHLRGLCRMHGLSVWFPAKRRRLWAHAGFVKEMDLAMLRDGLNTMDLNELRWACFLRGLSPLGLPRDELVTWLEQWAMVTKNTDRHSLSLLLHCPILLAYNYPSNWVLIH